MTLPAPWIEGRVIQQTHWTHSLRSITIACDPIGFEAGQFTRVGLMVDGEVLARAYSFVNAPGEASCEFYYVLVPGGPLTARLAILETGDARVVRTRCGDPRHSRPFARSATAFARRCL